MAYTKKKKKKGKSEDKGIKQHFLSLENRNRLGFMCFVSLSYANHTPVTVP